MAAPDVWRRGAHIAALRSDFRASTTLSDDRADLARALRGVPAEVEQLPTDGGGGEIALLVEPPGVGAEVESPTVGLDAEPHGRDRQVDPRHECTIAIEDPILGHDWWDRRVGEAFGEELLEPRLRDPALVRDGVEESEQLPGPGLAGSVTPLCGLDGSTGCWTRVGERR